MRFQDLDENGQTFLIDQLLSEIEGKAEKEGISGFIEPTAQEYKDFFNEYDKDYEIIDGYPESTIEREFHNRYSISFKNKKTILEVYPPNEL